MELDELEYVEANHQEDSIVVLSADYDVPTDSLQQNDLFWILDTHLLHLEVDLDEADLQNFNRDHYL